MKLKEQESADRRLMSELDTAQAFLSSATLEAEKARVELAESLEREKEAQEMVKILQLQVKEQAVEVLAGKDDSRASIEELKAQVKEANESRESVYAICASLQFLFSLTLSLLFSNLNFGVLLQRKGLQKHDGRDDQSYAEKGS